MKKFNEDELFCKECLTHDIFFKGGGSHATSSCPECGGTECILYEHMSSLKRSKARDKFYKMSE
jgi:hypothetical protein